MDSVVLLHQLMVMCLRLVKAEEERHRAKVLACCLHLLCPSSEPYLTRHAPRQMRPRHLIARLVFAPLAWVAWRPVGWYLIALDLSHLACSLFVMEAEATYRAASQQAIVVALHHLLVQPPPSPAA